MTGELIRSATRADIPQMRAVLVDAFAADPVMSWIQPNSELRPRMLDVMFDVVLRFFQPADRGGHVLLRADHISGAAVWAPPGRWQQPWWRQVRASPVVLTKMGSDNLKAFGGRGKQIDEALKSAHPDEPHWYLAGLGVIGGARGTGAGGALIDAGLERARAQGVPAYLECIQERVNLYERHGFRVLHDIAMPAGAPAQVGMIA